MMGGVACVRFGMAIRAAVRHCACVAPLPSPSPPSPPPPSSSPSHPLSSSDALRLQVTALGLFNCNRPHRFPIPSVPLRSSPPLPPPSSILCSVLCVLCCVVVCCVIRSMTIFRCTPLLRSSQCSPSLVSSPSLLPFLVLLSARSFLRPQMSFRRKMASFRDIVGCTQMNYRC